MQQVFSKFFILGDGFIWLIPLPFRIYVDTTHDFKAIMAWWREMAERNGKCDLRPSSPTVECFSIAQPITKTPSEISSISCIELECTSLQEKAATNIQFAWKCFVLRNNLRRQDSAAITIQSYYRRWLLRKVFLNQKHAVITIQSMLRRMKCCRDFQCYKTATKSAIIIQSILRGWIARRQACRHRYRILTIQVSPSRFRTVCIQSHLHIELYTSLKMKKMNSANPSFYLVPLLLFFWISISC